MPRIELAPEVGDDFDRIFDHLAIYDPERAAARIGDIIRAIDVLQANPQIGRPSAGDLRELVIGRDSQGYLALYLYLPEIETVFMLAVGSQREAGFKRN